MKSSIKAVFLLVALYGGLTGCATITRGTSEAFVVQTEPSGADVRLSSGETCKSPCTLDKKRKDNFVVFISKPGYEEAEVNVVSQVAGAGAAGMAGNVILGGIIGAGVDAASGATKELVPNPVDVTLTRIEETRDVAFREESGAANSINGVRGEQPHADELPVSEPVARSEELRADLRKKVHESAQGADYIWLDIRWQNGFPDRTIESAEGELRIEGRASDQFVTVPWQLHEDIEPGETFEEAESGFAVNSEQKLAWLLRAKTNELDVEFVPSSISFADGSTQTF